MVRRDGGEREQAHPAESTDQHFGRESPIGRDHLTEVGSRESVAPVEQLLERRKVLRGLVHRPI